MAKSGLNYRRMAYRNAVRASFAENNETSENKQQNQTDQTLNNGSAVSNIGQGVQSKDFKVYHAHGYVVHSENLFDYKQIWTSDSSFSEVFFSFDEAKNYLMKKFVNMLAYVYQNDPIFAGTNLDDVSFKKSGEQWKKEYISEYIDYRLTITEVSSDYDENAPIDFSAPRKIEWHFRYNGEVLTRYYIFGNKEYEFRQGDDAPSAGTKFKRGELVKYTDWEYAADYEGMLVVLNTPLRPQNTATPWENIYELLYIEDYYNPKRSGRVSKVCIHEADLEICSIEEIDDESRKFFNAPTLALQMVVMDMVGLDDKTTNSILNGEVLFNCARSWQSIAELADEE